MTQRSISLYIQINQFCLIWKWNIISFNKTIEKLKPNFKIVDTYISDKHVKSFVKCEYKPKKVQTPLIIMLHYDLETCNTDRAVPYCSFMFQMTKINGEYNRDMTEKVYEKCKNECFVLKGNNCINDTLDHVLTFKGKIRKINNKVVEYN